MKSDAQLREDIIRDLPETTDLVERVAIALELEFDRVVAECNGDPDFRAAARAAIEAYESALQARVEKLEGALKEIASSARGGDPLARDDDADTLAAIARHAARAALAEDYCGIVEVNEEDFKAEGEKG